MGIWSCLNLLNKQNENEVVYVKTEYLLYTRVEVDLSNTGSLVFPSDNEFWYLRI